MKKGNIKHGKYRKPMIPKNKKPTKEDLLKKHKKYKYHQISLPYQKGDVVDKILIHLKEITSDTKTSIIRNALFTYYNVMINNLKELQKSKKEVKKK